jgi:hypothetical protein
LNKYEAIIFDLFLYTNYIDSVYKDEFLLETFGSLDALKKSRSNLDELRDNHLFYILKRIREGKSSLTMSDLAVMTMHTGCVLLEDEFEDCINKKYNTHLEGFSDFYDNQEFFLKLTQEDFDKIKYEVTAIEY